MINKIVACVLIIYVPMIHAAEAEVQKEFPVATTESVKALRLDIPVSENDAQESLIMMSVKRRDEYATYIARKEIEETNRIARVNRLNMLCQAVYDCAQKSTVPAPAPKIPTAPLAHRMPMIPLLSHRYAFLPAPLNCPPPFP